MEAHQALPSLGFSRQEYWSGLPFPSHTCMCTYLHTYIYICKYTHMCMHACACLSVCTCRFLIPTCLVFLLGWGFWDAQLPGTMLPFSRTHFQAGVSRGPCPEDTNLLSLVIQASVYWARSTVCLSPGRHLFVLTSEIFLDPTRDSRLQLRS